MPPSTAGYLEKLSIDDLKRVRDHLLAALRDCTLCPRRCRVDRTDGVRGVCQTGRLAEVASYNAHFGEEAPLVGRHGSGTIFFSHCNLGCCFCQNADISLGGEGTPATADQLAGIMLALQDQGCHNINLVTPSHVVPQIVEALVVAAGNGLHLPLVYNSSGYDRVSTLGLLAGIMDIYMPDAKFDQPEPAQRFCQAADYPVVMKKALLEMHRQVGDLTLNDQGIANRGLLVRHLIMPQRLAGTRELMAFIAHRISVHTYVNLMSQYRPCGQAHRFPELKGRPTGADFETAYKDAREAGLKRVQAPSGRFALSL